MNAAETAPDYEQIDDKFKDLKTEIAKDGDNKLMSLNQEIMNL